MIPPMLKYYAGKLRATVLSRIAALRWKLQRRPGVLHGPIGEFRFSGTIVFTFWNPALIHLGDQLFHQPLMQLLASRFDVRIGVDNGLGPYFRALGFATLGAREAQALALQGAVLIGKDDVLHEVMRLAGEGNYFIGLNYPRLPEDERVTTALARAVLRILRELQILDLGTDVPELPPPTPPAALLAPAGDRPWVAQLQASGRRLLVFNDFVASDHLNARRRAKLLAQLARQKRSEGYRLVYVGSEADRRRAPATPDFIDHDLRGQLELIELYRLFGLGNVEGLISFDTFIAHVASQVGKDLYIVVKNLRKKDSFRARFVPMHQAANGLVKHFS
jgi:hypothetical protein